MSAISDYFRELMPIATQIAIGATPNLPEEKRVVALLVAFHKKEVQLAQAIEAGNKAVQWCEDAKPLFERGGGFEDRSNQVCRWLAELRAIEVVGGQRPKPLDQMLHGISVHLVGIEKTNKTCEVADALQRKALGHEG